MLPTTTGYAFATLLSSDDYLPGALAQVAALKELHTSPPAASELPFETVCLVTPESLDVNTIRRVRKVFDHVIGVEILQQDNKQALALLGRPDLTNVLTKLHVFRLTQYKKVIFLDADVLPIRPMSHLFAIDHEFSAVPDVGWPDIFNSGVLVLSPGNEKFDQLNHLVETNPSWDGGDQGLLNEWRAGNWNRLSFTYNTTPTAAYTYAPAYQRYGSDIKALHFIGPNKPWKSLRYHLPFSSSSPQQASSSSDSVQPAYDYDSLVHRWFQVYDRNYPPQQSNNSQSPFQVEHYTPAWGPPSHIQSTPQTLPTSSTPLDLDALKRVALQGLNASVLDSRPGEGTYKSMPLHGRVDLMRPRKQITEELSVQLPFVKSEQHTVVALEQSKPTPPVDLNASNKFAEDYFSTPYVRRAGKMPGPDEIPPSPRLRIISLPPTPSIFAPLPATAPDFYASESETEPLLLARSDQSHREEQLQHLELRKDFIQQEKVREEEPKPQEDKNFKRPVSPPVVSWNPAVEPPPNVIPTVNPFPTDTYFANVWDSTPSRHNDQIYPGPSPPDSGGFFKPPPLSHIPDNLVKQGHYRNVTGDLVWGATPSPDRTKIKTVFPWEEKPRVMPGRVFPESEAPPPALFLSPSSQSTTTNPSTPEFKLPSSNVRPQLLSPLHGLPSTLNYANAWDNIPSIQKYASRLVKPPPPQPLAPAFDDQGLRKGRSRSWDERAELSSRDGDDEDSADDEEDDVPSSRHKWDDSDGEAAKKRSRRGSIVDPNVLKGKKREYRSRGVQTFNIEKRSQGIQVDLSKPEPTRHRKSLSMSGRRHWAPATVPSVLAPTTSRDTNAGALDFSRPTQISLPPPPPLVLQFSSEVQKSGSASPPLVSPIRVPREFIVSPTGSKPPSVKASKPSIRTSNSSTSTITGPGPAPTSTLGAPLFAPVSSSSSSSAKPAAPRISPTSMVRHPSYDSSFTLGSPASSIGPLSPSDLAPLNVSSPLRQGSRVWDPARGVELFKRGSEEVLARFLKMGAWEDESR